MSKHILNGTLQTDTLEVDNIASISSLPGVNISDNKLTISEDLSLSKDLKFSTDNSIRVGSSEYIQFRSGRIDINKDVRVQMTKELQLSPYAKLVSAGSSLHTYISGNEICKVTGTGLEVTGKVEATGTISCNSISCSNPPWLSSESDPIFTSSAAYNITSTNINNWNTAHSWGNHATAGYLRIIGNTLSVDATIQNTGNSIVTGHLTSSSISVTNAVGFFGTSPQLQQTVTGSTAAQKIDSLIQALQNYGLIL